MKAVLVISDRDNVATALEPLAAGRRVDAGGVMVIATEPIASGHKIARRLIVSGEAVVKYGSPIGLASQDIPAGAHVHTHNLSSQRGRGDLGAQTGDPQPRLAEPPDEPDGSGHTPVAPASPRA